MSKENINDRFRNALGNYSSDVDEDILWEEIVDRVPKKKKRRRFFIWFFFGLGLALWMLKGLIPGNLNFQNESDAYSVKSDEHIITAELKNNATIAQIEEMDTEKQSAKHAINKAREIVKDTKSNQVISSVDFKEDGDKMDVNLTRNLGDVHATSFSRTTSLESRKEETIATKQRIAVQFPQEIDRLEIDLFTMKDNELIEIPVKNKKRSKRVKPQKSSRSFIEISAHSGKPFGSTQERIGDFQAVDFGTPHYTHGLAVSYSRFFAQKLYGIVNISADKIFMKYTDVVSRDTLVPTSSGEQIIAYNEYLNGVVDTESGIPMVKGTLTRDVLNLNSMTVISVGLGIGMNQPIGKWNLNFEALYQRSLFVSISGLGRAEGSNQIMDLDSFDDYFTSGSISSLSLQVKLDYALSNSISLTTGMQYQLGLTNILSETSKYSQKVNLMRLSIGIKTSL